MLELDDCRPGSSEGKMDVKWGERGQARTHVESLTVSCKRNGSFLTGLNVLGLGVREAEEASRGK